MQWIKTEAAQRYGWSEDSKGWGWGWVWEFGQSRPSLYEPSKQAWEDSYPDMNGGYWKRDGTQREMCERDLLSVTNTSMPLVPVLLLFQNVL